MNPIRDIHWGRIVVAGFLAEAVVFALFFLLLFGATLAGIPEFARPMSPFDYADAIVSSFASVFLFTLWVAKRIESRFVLHGILVGVVALLLFLVVIGTLSGSLAQPALYWVAHVLKILGGVAGGLVAGRRRHRIVSAKDSPVGT